MRVNLKLTGENCVGPESSLCIKVLRNSSMSCVLALCEFEFGCEDSVLTCIRENDFDLLRCSFIVSLL